MNYARALQRRLRQLAVDLRLDIDAEVDARAAVTEIVAGAAVEAVVVLTAGQRVTAAVARVVRGEMSMGSGASCLASAAT